MTSLKLINKTIIAALFFCLAATTLSAQKTYVVAVGLGKYKYPQFAHYLPCSVGDARSVSRFFHSYNGSSVFMLLNENATYEHIITVMKREFSKSSVSDEIIFVYSGHGTQGGLTCYETNSMGPIITYDEIQDVMDSAHARRKIILANACYSGGLSIKNTNNGKRRHGTARTSVMLYSSSRPNELSWESGQMNNSFFINRVLEAFGGAADANNDRKVTARELFNYVNPHVIQDTEGDQHPQLYGHFDDSMVVVYVK